MVSEAARKVYQQQRLDIRELMQGERFDEAENVVEALARGPQLLYHNATVLGLRCSILLGRERFGEALVLAERLNALPAIERFGVVESVSLWMRALAGKGPVTRDILVHVARQQRMYNSQLSLNPVLERIATPGVVPFDQRIFARVCFVCEKAGQMIKCSQCGLTYYCGVLCQEEDRISHKPYCAQGIAEYYKRAGIQPPPGSIIGEPKSNGSEI